MIRTALDAVYGSRASQGRQLTRYADLRGLLAPLGSEVSDRDPVPTRDPMLNMELDDLDTGWPGLLEMPQIVWEQGTPFNLSLNQLPEAPPMFQPEPNVGPPGEHPEAQGDRRQPGFVRPLAAEGGLQNPNPRAPGGFQNHRIQRHMDFAGASVYGSNVVVGGTAAGDQNYEDRTIQSVLDELAGVADAKFIGRVAGVPTWLALTAGTGVVIDGSHVIGRIPSHPIPICRAWTLYSVYSAATPVWRQVNLLVSTAPVTVGVPSPVFGKVTGLIVNVREIGSGGHLAGTVDFYVYNKTTTSATDSPQLDNLDPTNPTTTGYGQTWDDGLAVSYGDLLELWCRCTTGSQAIAFSVEATFIIEEQTAYEITGTLSPDATGVVVRLGQQGGLPAFERVDGAYWLWWDGSTTWTLSTVKGTAGAAYWERVDPNPVGAYTAAGTATGTATVAAG